MKLRIFALLFLLISCTQPILEDNNKINVVVSFYPLEEFTKSIGAQKVNVISLVPPGVEPHEWEPSPGDIVKISKAKLFIYNGAGLESWIEKILKNVDTKKTLVVSASNGINLITKSNAANSQTDPHVWLDPNLVAMQARTITNALSAIDPSGAEFYNFNLNEFISNLNSLDKKFRTELSDCQKKEFVTSHDAFGYLARSYGLSQFSVAGISSEIEPTPKHLANLINVIKEKNIKVIFVETMVNPKISRAIAKDASTSVDVLNPFEGLTQKEISDGQNYFSVMEQNLNKLKDALDCKK